MNEKYNLIDEKGEVIMKYRIRLTAESQKPALEKVYGKLKIEKIK